MRPDTRQHLFGDTDDRDCLGSDGTLVMVVLTVPAGFAVEFFRS